MNIVTSQSKRSGSGGTVPLPWEVLYQFGRVICLGAIALLGMKLALREPGNLTNRARDRRDITGTVNSGADILLPEEGRL